MKKISQIFLKHYFGYKNFGDELLLFGVLARISEKFPRSSVTIASGDPARLQTRLDRHPDLIPSDLRISPQKNRAKTPKNSHKIFGGGEVLSDEDQFSPPDSSFRSRFLARFFRHFTRSGRNFFLRFPSTIFHKNFSLLGGIGQPQRRTTRRLFRCILPRARHIAVRDQDSLARARLFSPRAEFHGDFAIPPLQKLLPKISKTRSPSDRPFILLNLSSHAHDKMSQLVEFAAEHPEHRAIFFPCDLHDDSTIFPELQRHLPQLEIFDRSQHSLREILPRFFHADAAIGSRLHFLVPLAVFQRPHTAISYKSKVSRVLATI